MANDIVTPSAELIGYTVFDLPLSLQQVYEDSERWPSGDLEGAQHIAEFAGRACYQSWGKPNPATATNAGYLRHILDVGHESVLEHGVASFYVTGVSRSLTHELVRHRHLSPSQLSQRYVDSADAGIVVPPELRGLGEDLLRQSMARAVDEYERLVSIMTAKLTRDGVGGTEARKRGRQAARCVMPSMTETRIVVTGNLRAWRHFLTLRAAAPADVEIRELAMLIYDQLLEVAPNALQDFEETKLVSDGSRALRRVDPDA